MEKRIRHSCAEAIPDEKLFRSEIVHKKIPGFSHLVDAKDRDGCIELLASRMRTKETPSFSPYRGRPEGAPDLSEQAKADAILNGIFTLPDAHGGFITEKLVGDFEWSPSFEGERLYHPPKMFRYYLNQHEPLTTLANTYWKTGEAKYRDRIIELLVDWIRRVPTYWELLPGGELQRQHWQNMITRNRFEKWLDFYHLIAPALSDRDAIDLLKAMVFHSRLMNLYVANNIGSRISGTLAGMIKVNLKFALLFHETASAEASIETFKRHFRTAIDAVYYPDGGLKYRCTDYHKAVSVWCVQAVKLAEELEIEDIDYEAQMTRKMEAYTAFLMKPDSSLPLLGDTDYLKDERWRNEKLMELNPDTPSQAFEWSGLYAMRTGWDEEALYLFFTAGPYGIMHNHQDHLSFEVSGYGKHLIVEPGRTPYGRTEQRNRLSSSMAHNTLTVDGLGQHRTHIEPDGPSKNHFFTCHEFDFVDGRFDEGFGPDQSLKVSHVRSILFVKPEYFLVMDQVLGDGAHNLVWHFMFYPQSMRVDREHNRAVSEESEGANISFTWSDPGLEPEIIAGEKEFPYRGMMTSEGDRPAPSLFLKRRADLPLTVSFLIEPFKASERPQTSLKQLEARNGIAFRVERKDGTEDVILLAQGAASVGGLSSDGIVTLLRFKEKIVNSVLTAGANRITFKEKSVLELDVPVRWI